MEDKKLSVVLGILTILCWGSLATFGKLLVHLPPFYILGVSFFLGGLLSLQKFREVFQDWRVFLWGTLGFFGYHFFLFYSFRFAPAVEANLINYLWPVIMVLLTPVFFREQSLKWFHFTGGALAICGSVVLVSTRLTEMNTDGMKGYALALCAALTWPVYSLGRRKLPKTSTWSVGGFCFGASGLCLLTHFQIEPLVNLQFRDGWKLFLMGIGPFGLAFYCWDKALELGSPKVLGALAYLTPVLSTLGLILFTDERLTGVTGIAMILIIGGASFGLLDFLPSRKVK